MQWHGRFGRASRLNFCARTFRQKMSRGAPAWLAQAGGGGRRGGHVLWGVARACRPWWHFAFCDRVQPITISALRSREEISESLPARMWLIFLALLDPYGSEYSATAPCGIVDQPAQASTVDTRLHAGRIRLMSQAPVHGRQGGMPLSSPEVAAMDPYRIRGGALRPGRGRQSNMPVNRMKSADTRLVTDSGATGGSDDRWGKRGHNSHFHG